MVIKIFLIIFCLFLPFVVQGAVIINEIAWMGTDISYNDEWIELYNTSDNSINLDGWVLKAEDRTPEIALTGTISAKGFYLLERTDDETVPEISVNLIYKGALGNKGEDLKLYDNSGNLIDEVDCSDGWPAGDNKTKQTMERTDSTETGSPQGWQTSQNPGGTPKAENSSLPIQPAEDSPPLAETQDEKLPEVGPPAAEPVSYPTRVVFSEILPSPEGPDAENEWIEIFNQNNFEVDISGWKIKDKEGKITIYTFSAGTKISTLGYLVLERPETKITLNNSGEGLDFIYPNGEIGDSITFGKASVGQSYNRTPTPPQQDWAWSSILTPGAKNIVPKNEPSFAEASEGKKKSEDGPLSAGLFGKKTADVGKKLAKSSGFFSTLSIAFGIAILSAIIILFLKKKTSSKSPF